MTSTDSNYLFLDTEGTEELREIAILDHNGTLVYEAFTEGNLNNSQIRLNLKPLALILKDLSQIAQNKTIICHYAEHDRQVIHRSYTRAKISLPTLKFGCTYELARQILPNTVSYSLEYLSKHLNLKVKNKRFNPAQAHTARYDAEFTHQLYLKLQPTMQNPFDSIRVDTPFQTHPDFHSVYESEFNLLKSTLIDIKSDIVNHQSRGVVIIGEAGSGKTHLIMRIAQELLKTNRLLFIDRPNNASAVLQFTYSKILESFAEKVPGNNSYTQMELLIANSLTNILSRSERFQAAQRGQNIVKELQNDPLSLYQKLGKEGARNNLENWQFIEKHITDWWGTKYAIAGHSSAILQGIIRFCRYTDLTKKDLTRRWLAGQELEPEDCERIGLTNWQEDMSREEFALEAISVFGKLSMLDQPLIIVFDQLEGLVYPRNADILQSFSESVKDIITRVPNSLIILNLFPNSWQQFKEKLRVEDPNAADAFIDRFSPVRLNRPSSEKMRQILQIKAGTTKLNTLFTPLELDDILSRGSIRKILKRASAYLNYKHQNIPLPAKDDDYDSISLDTRVEQLESILKQIAQLVITIPLSLEVNNLPLISEDNFTAKIPKATDTIHSIEFEALDLTKYFQTQRAELDQNYDRPTIINDANEIGKLATIIEASGKGLDHLRLGKNKLPEHILINHKNTAIGFLNGAGANFAARIKNLNQITVSYPNIQFHLIRDARESEITGKVGKEEIAKLNHSPNGKFTIMDKSDRLNFELIYKTIIDIENQDLDVDINTVLKALTLELSDFWLIKLI
jgi:DNA polymerase III epsilon subunit-like protein